MSATLAPAELDLCGPLPRGTTLLEASAGTGKTYAICALTARYVAEGVPLGEILLVTFTRMATSELRDRVRTRLVDAEQALARARAGAPPGAGADPVTTLLATGDPEALARRHERLRAAVADFDQATITTIHGYCMNALDGLGLGRDLTFVDDVRDLVDQTVDDLFLRQAAADPDSALALADARRAGRAAAFDPFARLAPHADPDSVAGRRTRFAEEVRAALEARKRRLGVQGYDDLQGRLRAALADTPAGERARTRLRTRHRIALVDEFQDTDPVQWRIMERVFAGAGATLVLIGDPKQAIYAFRGADVHAYLAAGRIADTHMTLGTNRRCDAALIAAHGALMAGAQLGDAGIVYRDVVAAPGRDAPGLVGAPTEAALRVRVLDPGRAGLSANNKGHVGIDDAREHIAADLAADVARLLGSGASLVRYADDGSEADRSAFHAGHVAVLVRRNADATRVREALREAGIPAVINGAGSVFASPAAGEWARLLAALERPGSRGRVASAALTTFLGWSAERVAGADEDEWGAVHARCHRWADVLRSRGVATLLETIMVEERLPRRALATLDGERTLTDIRHVGRLLHVAAADGQLGVASLAGWLSEQIAEAPDEAEAEERTRRLEGDDDAVQVLTVHRAKGLEFPVAYCPFLFVPGYVPRKGEADPRFHAPPDDVRTLDVGGRTGEDYDAHYTAHLAEERGEDLRLAYVALTRARHRVVTWWAPYRDVGDSPLARLLLGRDPSSGEVAVSVEAPGLPRVRERLEELAGAAPGCIAIEESGWHDVGPGDARAGPAATLRAATLERALDARWQRTSYSRITERAHEAPAVASEPERTDGVAPDEPDVEPAEEAAAAQAVPDVPLPLAGLAGGTDLGHLVHRVLERTDFSAPELEAGLRARIVAESARGGPADLDAAVLASGLRAAVETPLGPLVGDMRLRDIAPGDRIDELGFELPLAGGESPHGEVTVAALAGLLRDHLPEHDPVRPYADRLSDPMLEARLRGYMVGSIDLVWRLSDGGRPRFVVVDHKTNRLAPREQRPTAAHFRPAALDRAMREADYPLQALVYQVALHRYLRWRVPGYDPGRDLAGVLYLFTRGLVGADVPRVAGAPIGVWAWHPPAVLVEAVSDLFDRGAPS